MSWPETPSGLEAGEASAAGAAAAVSHRRWLLTAWGVSVYGLFLSGCGFKLRGTVPLAVRRVALAGFGARSPIAVALRQQLAPQVQLVEDAATVDAVIVALDERREKAVLAATAGKLVREVQLRSRLRFRIDRRGGAPGLPEMELVQSRDMSTSESLALAKAHEEADLHREMEAEIARQVVQRLAVLKP